MIHPITERAEIAHGRSYTKRVLLAKSGFGVVGVCVGFAIL